MSKQVILEFPDDFPEAFLYDPEILNAGKTVIILKMLRKRATSLDRAAELLEIDQEALLDLMEKYDAPDIDTTGREPEDPTPATAGAWRDLLDCQAFEREVYESRHLSLK